MGVFCVFLGSSNISYAKYDEIIRAFDAENHELAFEKLQKLAQKDDIKAQLVLAKMLAIGRGTPVNTAQALVWFRRAAALGSASAQNYIGQAYEGGVGVEVNHQEAVKWYRLAAEQGDWDAQLSLSIALEKGQGVKKNIAESIKWLRRLAEEGPTVAQYRYGLKLMNGDGVTQNHSMAAFWFEEAADGGYAKGRGALGILYHQGKGVPQDFKKAAKLILNAASPDLPEFMAYAGTLYENGEGVEKDNLTAFVYYSLAVKGGYKKAINHRDSIAKLLTKAELAQAREVTEKVKATSYTKEVPGWNKIQNYFFHSLPKTPVKIKKMSAQSEREWHNRSLALAREGSSSSQFMVGLNLQSENPEMRDIEASIEWLNKSAEQGNGNAQRHLARQYECGYLIPKNREKAISYYRMLTKELDEPMHKLEELAQRKIDEYEGRHFNELTGLLSKIATLKKTYGVVKDSDKARVGELYYLGAGTPKNLGEAYKWFVRSIDHPTARFYLGLMYENGEIVEQDYSVAKQLFTKALKLKHPEASFRLAVLFDKGLGVEENPGKAFEYYEAAANNGLSKAHFNLGDLHLSGRGLNIDKVRAYLHYKLSFLFGDDQGAVKAKALALELSKEQLEDVGKRLAVWKEKYNESKRCMQAGEYGYNAFIH